MIPTQVVSQDEPRSSIIEFVAPPTMPTLTPQVFAEIENLIIARINSELGQQLTVADINEPDPGLARKVEEYARRNVMPTLTTRSIPYSGVLEDRFAQSILNRLLGYAWLEAFLPPTMDVIEIMLNQDGTLWTIPRGGSLPKRENLTITSTEATQVIGKILSGANRRVTEAEPIVDADLPRCTRFPTGARVHVVNAPIANGDYPILNIRFQMGEPVRSETLVAWGACSQELFDFLVNAVRKHYRIVIAGGTGSGKTTLLSAIGNYIAPDERTVLIEDTPEVVLDLPHVVSMKSRPPSIEGKYGIDQGDLVVSAMRMTPRWLVVGEVRTGRAGSALLSAQMSDHPGLSTIHAFSPAAVVDRLTLLMGTDEKTTSIREAIIKRLLAQAVDLVVQIEFVNGVRRVTHIAELMPSLKAGDVAFNDLWQFDPGSTTWRQVGDLTRPPH